MTTTTRALLTMTPSDTVATAEAHPPPVRPIAPMRLPAARRPAREPLLTTALRKLFFWRHPVKNGSGTPAVMEEGLNRVEMNKVEMGVSIAPEDIQQIELKEETVSTRTVSALAASPKPPATEMTATETTATERTASTSTVEVHDETVPPASAALVGQGLDDIIYAALVDHTKQLKRAICEQLNQHAAEVETRMREHVESVCQTARESHETMFTALSGLRDEFVEFRQNVLLRFGNIEKIGSGLDTSLGKIDSTTRELAQHCQSQSSHFEEQVTVTRESLDDLRETGEKRLRDIGAHYQEKESLMKAEQEKRRVDNERVQQSYSERLRGFSEQLEQLALRLQSTVGESELPPLDDLSTGRRLWRWATGPIRLMQRRKEAEHRLTHLCDALRLDRDEILGVRNLLHTFSREVHHAKNGAHGSSASGNTSTRTVGRIAPVSRSEDMRKVS